MKAGICKNHKDNDGCTKLFNLIRNDGDKTKRDKEGDEVEITDIWFRTELDLMDLGKKIELDDLDYDMENYWEWITGDLGRVRLDITRTHLKPPRETDTRIFILGGSRVFTDELIEKIAERLKKIGITPVYLGSWEYVSGNNFDIVEIEKIE